MTELLPVNEKLLEQLIKQSRTDGKASELIMHGTSEQTPWIMYTALQPGFKAYFIPHCHPNAKETFTHLKGELELITFNEVGKVTQKHKLEAGEKETFTVERGVHHTLIALTCNAAVKTIYHGAYEEKVVPDWAIPENAGEARIERYMREIQTTTLV